MGSRDCILRDMLGLALLVGRGCSPEGATGEHQPSTEASNSADASDATPAPSLSPVDESNTGVNAANNAEPQPKLEGLVATIDGRAVEFRSDMLTYNGRPPTMDMSAGSDDPSWLTLRVFVAPDGQGTIAPGEYPCGLGKSWLMLIGASGVYVSYEAPGTCSVHVSEPGVERGEVFSGTFSGTLVKSDGSPCSSLTARSTGSSTEPDFERPSAG